jgi:hypothetical protein
MEYACLHRHFVAIWHYDAIPKQYKHTWSTPIWAQVLARGTKSYSVTLLWCRGACYGNIKPIWRLAVGQMMLVPKQYTPKWCFSGVLYGAKMLIRH